MGLITNTPFKKRYSIMPKNIVAVMQVKRISKENTKFDDAILAESYEEVLELISLV